MVEMVKCPYCGEEVSPGEYIGHVSRHGEGASWERLSPERISPEAFRDMKEIDRRKQAVRKLLDDVRSFAVKRDFEPMLKAGAEALVEIGRLFPSEALWATSGASVYNNITISLLSAYKSDWDTAIRFATQAVETARRGY